MKSSTCPNMFFGTTKRVAQISLLCWVFKSIGAFIYTLSVVIKLECYGFSYLSINWLELMQLPTSKSVVLRTRKINYKKMKT